MSRRCPCIDPAELPRAGDAIGGVSKINPVTLRSGWTELPEMTHGGFLLVPTATVQIVVSPGERGGPNLSDNYPGIIGGAPVPFPGNWWAFMNDATPRPGMLFDGYNPQSIASFLGNRIIGTGGIVDAQRNDATLANMFGSGAAPLVGLPVNTRDRWADQCLEATDVAGNGVTLTLAAPGASLRQHLVMLKIEKFFAVGSGGSGAPDIVTSTNLVGTPSFNFATSGSSSSVIEKLYQPRYAVRASAANTAVTVVCPAVADIIWKVTAWWYNA